MHRFHSHLKGHMLPSPPYTDTTVRAHPVLGAACTPRAARPGGRRQAAPRRRAQTGRVAGDRLPEYKKNKAPSRESTPWLQRSE